MNYNGPTLLGWKLIPKERNFIVKKIEFKQTSNIQYLTGLIFNGEYVSSFPFGLFNVGQETFIILLEELKETENYLQVGKNFGIMKKSNKLINNINIPSKCCLILLKTLLDFIFFERGFSKPFENRGCLGKYSKGSLIQKKNSKIVEDLFDFSEKRVLYIAPAIEFDFISDDSDIIMTFLSKNEIYDEDLSLPIKFDIKEKILRNEKYRHLFYKTPEIYLKTHQWLDSIFKINGDLTSLFNIESIKPINESFLKFPNEFQINNQIIQNLNIINYQDYISKFMQNNMNLIYSDKISLYIEDSCLTDVIHEFKTFLNESGLEIIEKSTFIRNELILNEIEAEKKGSIIILKSNESHFEDYFYYLIKNLQNQRTKIIYSDSLKNADNWRDILISIIFSLYYRTYDRLLLKIPSINDIEQKSFFSFKIIRDFNYKINLLYYSEYNTKTNEIYFSYKVIKWNNWIDSFISEIKSVIKPNSVIILYQDFWFNSIFCEWKHKIKNSVNYILIKKIKGKIIQSKNAIIKNPRIGTYLEICNGKYLLTTTQVQDNNFGLPNPLLIDFTNYLKIQNRDEIFQIIYYLTFLNPLTQKKNLLPINIHLLNRIVFKYNWNTLQEIINSGDRQLKI